MLNYGYTKKFIRHRKIFEKDLLRDFANYLKYLFWATQFFRFWDIQVAMFEVNFKISADSNFTGHYGLKYHVSWI